MTTYKNIHGKRVKTFATDLGNAEAEGQIFFSTASPAREFKTVVASAAWSAGGSGITARPAIGGFGIQTSAVMFGGGPASTASLTEEYNGTGFTTSGTLNTGRPTCQDNGWGVETAGIAASGNSPGGNTVNVEEYNGTSWTEVNNVSVARRQQASIGLVQTAGAICGGFATANTNATEEYDGTNWTGGGNLNTTRRGFVGAGTLTAGIVYSGFTTEIVTNTEEYNGTAWTNATAINTARNNGAGSTNATQGTALLFGGNTGSDTGNTEQYDGTSWTEIADMSVARDGLGGGGIGSTALAAFGKTSANVSITEEFNTTVNTVTGAAWASGGNMVSGRLMLAGCGTQTAGLAFGGEDPSTTADTEEYNGTSWSEQNNLPSVKQKHGSAGTQTAALCIGGTPDDDQTSHYGGTSWTAGGNLGTGRYDISGTGTQTAALAFGGNNDPDGTEEYNGSSWTAGGNLNTGRALAGRAGTQTAALGFGGYTPSPAGHTNKTEGYNGTAWTELSATMNVSKRERMTDGTNTAALACGGAPGTISTTEIYDGTSWVTSANLGTGRYFGGGAGTTAAFLAFGGGPDTDATEEFTPESTALNLKTITDS